MVVGTPIGVGNTPRGVAAKARYANLTGTTKPVPVMLTIVGDSGMTSVKALIFHLYQVPECVTRWADSRIGCGLIQDGKHMEVCHHHGDFVAG
jgi:hypothetical protein